MTNWVCSHTVPGVSLRGRLARCQEVWFIKLIIHGKCKFWSYEALAYFIILGSFLWFCLLSFIVCVFTVDTLERGMLPKKWIQLKVLKAKLAHSFLQLLYSLHCWTLRLFNCMNGLSGLTFKEAIKSSTYPYSGMAATEKKCF